jgi:glyoxylase-like metal-dependent hydrolase (beta-lactamase superfamily II)
MCPGLSVLHEADSFDPALETGSVGGVLKLALLSALALWLAAPSARAQPAPEFPRPEDGYFQETIKVAPGVWTLAEPRFQVQPIGNVTVIEQSDGLVLVDSGGSPGSARRIATEIRRLSPKPVKAVIITHWHGDHPQGLSEILKAWPQARTISTRATQAHLRERKTMNTPAAFDPAADEAFYKRGQGFIAYSQRMADQAVNPSEKAGWSATARLFTQYAEDMRGAVTIPTSEAFDERLDLPDARTPVEVRFLGRANTDGDAVVWLPKQRVLVSGDVVVAPFPFGFGSYPADWLRTLERLRAYDFKVLVPGHGPPQRDHAYLDRLSAAITEVRAKVAPLAVQGFSLEDVRKRVDFTDQAQTLVGDDPWLRRWFGEYWIAPFVASAYKEARQEPIIQGLSGG